MIQKFFEQWESNYIKLTKEAEQKEKQRQFENKNCKENRKSLFYKLMLINIYLIIIITVLLLGKIFFIAPTGLSNYEGLSDYGISGFIKRNAPKEDLIDQKKWKKQRGMK